MHHYISLEPLFKKYIAIPESMFMQIAGMISKISFGDCDSPLLRPQDEKMSGVFDAWLSFTGKGREEVAKEGIQLINSFLTPGEIKLVENLQVTELEASLKNRLP